MLKTVIVNIPLRDKPAFPPLGVTRIYDVLISSGFNELDFYDIDSLRPSEEELISYFKEKKPNIIAISAVVSTSYKYVKWFTNEINKILPNTLFILGGNMAASYEVILRRCNIHVCFIGDGELSVVKFYFYLKKYKKLEINEELRSIIGIAFLNQNNGIEITGKGEQLKSSEIKQADYDLLKKTSKIEHYIKENPQQSFFYKYDKRTHELKRKGYKEAVVMASKGCTAKCTFCHRWTSGYRRMTVDSIIEYICYLKESFNVGFLEIGDENFGVDRRFVDEFTAKIKSLDVLWTMSMRVEFVNKEVLLKMKDAGCTSIMFGIESGSNKMLTIMEKRSDVSANINALKLLKECELFTVVQLVIGMPGENNNTINETLNFLKTISEYVYDPTLISINYAQALPGSPLYEYAILNGYIKNTVEDQECYLLKITNVNASDLSHYINMTEESLYNVFSWQYKLSYSLKLYFLKNKIKFSNVIIDKKSLYKIILYKYFPRVFIFLMFINRLFKSKKSILNICFYFFNALKRNKKKITINNSLRLINESLKN